MSEADVRTVILVMGKEGKPLTIGETLMRMRSHGFRIDVGTLKNILGNLTMAGYVDRKEEDFGYKYYLTGKGKKAYVDIVKRISF